MNNNIIDKIIDYLKENTETFNNLIEDLDSYNGFLGDDRYYNMNDLDEIYSDSAPTDVLLCAFYGYDDPYGCGERAAFNPNRDYFRFNGYGNLVSSDEKDYSDKLDDYFIKECAENRAHLYAIDDDATLTELFDQLEKPVYTVRTYYDLNERGLESEFESTDEDEINSFIWDEIQKGVFVTLTDEDGNKTRYYIDFCTAADPCDIDDYMEA